MNQEEGSSSNSSPMIFKIEQKQFESLSDLKSPQKELISPSIDSFSLDNGSNIIPGLSFRPNPFVSINTSFIFFLFSSYFSS